jgi:hypothetical protein
MTAQVKVAAPESAGGVGPFVINLCSSTTPMALSHPDTPELKRFSFFMSRRREEGRERFRLHMGYFMTMAEAEEWLNVVRDIYPGAWAGEAPGKKLAERAAAAAAPKVPAAPAPLKVVPPVQSAPVNVPTLQAAPVPVPAVAAPAPAAPKAAAVAKPPVAAPPKPKASLTSSNVREVLKALDETDETRSMPAPAVAAKPVAQPNLSDSQVLKILENRQVEKPSRGHDEASKSIELLRPDDTATVRALKDAIQRDAPVSFAVQLHWSVQPIDLAKVPPLAIFSAYTLYTVDGSRDGRKWYGLRLGFFTDAISAKQVASYVRSEFTSVAVIPVTSQERDRATDGNKKTPANAALRARKPAGQRADEFKLIDDQTDEAIPPALQAAQAQMKAKKPAPASRKPAKKTGDKVVHAKAKRSPKTLEETLEILGASELEIDNGRGELLNNSGVRHLGIERVRKNSPFSKLLERLSERSRKA